MRLNKFGMLCLFIISIGAIINTMTQIVLINQSSELIKQADYLKALIEENGGGR